ncbi:MAG: hypothetical protein VW644_10745 [Alphaproteobacteria bacterium]
MRYRVVVRAHTARRDTAASVLVERALEAAGFDVFIASLRNFDWVMRLWKPHIVIVQTPGSALRVHEMYPDAKTVFLDAEGLQPETNSWATFWSQNPRHYEVIDRALLWGPALVEDMHQLMAGQDFSKVRVVGSPKFDLLQYLDRNRRPQKPPQSIGIVGRHPSINSHEGRPTIWGLHLKSNLDFTVSSIRAYHVQHQVVGRILRETDYTISLRPHPLEAIESYHRYVIPSFGAEYADRFTVDDRLDVAEWMLEQRALLSPTSTAYIEAYQLGVPFIIVDRISGMYDYNANYADICREWLESAFVPDSIDEAVALIIDAPNLDTRSPTMDSQLARFCGLPNKESSVARVVAAIIEMVAATPPKPSKGLVLPKILIEYLDEFIFRRAMRRNPMHANFNYKKGFHQPPDYTDDVLRQAGLQANGRTTP